MASADQEFGCLSWKQKGKSIIIKHIIFFFINDDFKFQTSCEDRYEFMNTLIFFFVRDEFKFQKTCADLAAGNPGALRRPKWRALEKNIET